MTELRLTRSIHREDELLRWLDEHAPQGVTSLSLWDAQLTDAGVMALVAHPMMESVRTLDLSWNLIGPDGARALAERLPHLESLRLYHNDLHEHGADAVARGPWRLRSLNLCGNGIGVGGMARLSAGPALRGLRSLHLGRVGLGDRGVEALLEGDWPTLHELNVRDNEITAAGVARLVDGTLPALERLGLDDNPIDDEGLRAMTRGVGWRRLRWLNLGGTELSCGAIGVIRDAPATRLRELRVQCTKVDPAPLGTLLPDCVILA